MFKGFNYISEFVHCLATHWILVPSWFKISLQYLGIITSILFITILDSLLYPAALQNSTVLKGHVLKVESSSDVG